MENMETVGLGFYYEDLPLGRQFKTIGRTVTEPDIVNFINATGMTEVIFMDMEFLEHESDIKGRVAPGALDLEAHFWLSLIPCRQMPGAVLVQSLLGPVILQSAQRSH